MNRLLVWGIAAAIAASLSYTPQPAAAQASTSEGIVSGKTYAAIGRGATVSVEPEDDTDLNLRLRPIIAKALRARGYRIAEHAQVRFIYNADTPATRRIKNNLRRSAERGSGVNRDPRERTGPMRNPLIRQGLNLSGRPLKPSEDRHLVSVIVLNDKGTQYWVGTAHVDGYKGDSFDVTSVLSRQLVRQLGHNVDQRRFRVN
jgi:hypothetical protein